MLSEIVAGAVDVIVVEAMLAIGRRTLTRRARGVIAVSFSSTHLLYVEVPPVVLPAGFGGEREQ